MTIPAHKDTIMVHCLATRPSWSSGKSLTWVKQQVTKWHVKDRGWRDIGYAMIIGRKGNSIDCRDLNDNDNVFDDTAAAAKGWNRRAIHIALDGGYGSSAFDEPEEHFTPAQLAKLRDVIEHIQKLAGRKMKIMGHNEVANKGCPGFQVGPWWANKKPRSIIKSTTLQGSAVGAAATGTAAVTALGQVHENTQLILSICFVVVLLAFLWIARERVKKWVTQGIR